LGSKSLVFLSVVSLICGQAPEFFDDYFDQDIRIVEVEQKTALKACLATPGPMIVRINEATRTCLGGDNYFDWNDFAKFNSGGDTNNNGISNSMEQKEMCFYKEMGWFDGQDMVKSQILADFDSWNDEGIQASFNSGINDCASWGGSFEGSRKKRSIEEEESYENLSMLSHIRNKRQAPPRKGGPGPKAQGPKGAQVKKVGKGPNGAGPGGARKVAGPAKGKGVRKTAPAKGNGGKGPQGIRTAGNGPKKGPAKKAPGGPAKNGAKKVGPGQGQQGERKTAKDDTDYNKLWCTDLVVQFGLKKCVEDMLKNI